jgi:hypothetical protein
MVTTPRVGGTFLGSGGSMVAKLKLVVQFCNHTSPGTQNVLN